MKKNILTILKTIGMLVWAFAMITIGQGLGMLLTLPLSMSEDGGIKFIGEYLSFIGIWIVVIAYCLIVKKNRYLFSFLGTKQAGNNVKTALLVGLPCGIGLNLLIAFLAMLNGDIALSYASFNPLMIIAFIVSIGIQSGAEEIIDRWFIYRKVLEYFPGKPVLAIAINACFFGAIHLMNPGVHVNAIINIILVGILYALMVYYFDSLWAAIIAHTSWNFCQSILLGLPNSGIVSQYSIFQLDASTARDSFVYNVNFGIEGTVMTDIALAVACVVVILIGRKKKKKAAVAA